jgi:hypothetical protein
VTKEIDIIVIPLVCLTGWPETYAIPNEEAYTVAEFLVTNFF